jgi:hypothetical protein
MVSWSDTPVNTYLHLKKSEFPVAPNMLLRPGQAATPITPQSSGNYYIYFVGNPVWAMLY